MITTVTNNAPNIFPLGPTTVTFTATDAAGNTASATSIVTVNTLTVPIVNLSLNRTAFNVSPNKVMTLTQNSVASTPATNADLYIALQLPDGTLLVMQPGGSFSTALTPKSANISVTNFTGVIFNYTFTGVEPFGTYTWFAALTQPGTLNVIGTLTSAPFTFGP